MTDSTLMEPRSPAMIAYSLPSEVVAAGPPQPPCPRSRPGYRHFLNCLPEHSPTGPEASPDSPRTSPAPSSADCVALRISMTGCPVAPPSSSIFPSPCQTTNPEPLSTPLPIRSACVSVRSISARVPYAPLVASEAARPHACNAVRQTVSRSNASDSTHTRVREGLDALLISSPPAPRSAAAPRHRPTTRAIPPGPRH